MKKKLWKKKIEKLLKEKKEINVKIKQIEFESLVFNLKGEREELRERIEILRSEKKDVVRDMKVVSFMGELRCP